MAAEYSGGTGQDVPSGPSSGLARVFCVALAGVEGSLVEVEADLALGLPGLRVVGLPDTAVNEARDRVRAAVVNSGEAWPQRRITLGLSPATLPKVGSAFDLAMAVAVLAAAGACPAEAVRDAVVLGELGLDGRVRGVPGVLPAVLRAVAEGRERVVVPSTNVAEAGLVPGAQVIGVRSLRHLLAVLRGEDDADRPSGGARDLMVAADPAPDLADVVGQATGRRAIEVAAAGGHNVMFLGPPGCGKTMLAERLPGLLPPLAVAEAMEVSAVHSVAGLLTSEAPLVTRPPFRAPHHSASVASLVGGGSGLLRPGAVSLAHRGVLFLDEAPEFAAGALDALRQPLESGVVEIARARATARFPARFVLVLAANPCPCARADGAGDLDCACTPLARRRYLGRLSGPLLDRIDLRVRLLPVTRADLLGELPPGEPTAVVAQRVRTARGRAAVRFEGTPWTTVAEVPGPELRARWSPPRPVMARLLRRADRGQLSARAVDRVLRVSWTLADLAGLSEPGIDQVEEAVLLRGALT